LASIDLQNLVTNTEGVERSLTMRENLATLWRSLSKRAKIIVEKARLEFTLCAVEVEENLAS